VNLLLDGPDLAPRHGPPQVPLRHRLMRDKQRGQSGEQEDVDVDDHHRHDRNAHETGEHEMRKGLGQPAGRLDARPPMTQIVGHPRRQPQRKQPCRQHPIRRRLHVHLNLVTSDNHRVVNWLHERNRRRGAQGSGTSS
jgi:hypothetical protein